MNKIYTIIIVFLVACTSCGDFLKEYSSNLEYAGSCKDMEEVLLGEGYMIRVATSHTDIPTLKGENVYFPWIHLMTDEIEETVRSKPSGTNFATFTYAGFYSWQKNPFLIDGKIYEDESWRNLYRHIGAVNVILNKVEEFKADDPELANRLFGEAYFLRAYYYYTLVNIYAKPYNKSTAATDPGVPLKITEFIEDKYYSRNSVASVYEQIVKDLENSIKYFGDQPAKSMRRASGAAARLLLSRIYLYMGEWEKVVSTCDAVRWSYSLEDLNGRDATKSFIHEKSPELIFSQGGYMIPNFYRDPYMNLFYYKTSNKLAALFTNNDLRRTNFFSINKNVPTALISSKMRIIGGYDSKDCKFSDICLMRYPEVLLNKAEALAMLDRDGEAASELLKLQEKRLVNTAPISETGEALVNLIRTERQKELCMEGQRWFDIRRYAVSPKYPLLIEIDHEHFTSPTVKIGFKLKKYGEDPGGYVMPIPGYAIMYNNGQLEDNERGDRNQMD